MVLDIFFNNLPCIVIAPNTQKNEFVKLSDVALGCNDIRSLLAKLWRVGEERATDSSSYFFL